MNKTNLTAVLVNQYVELVSPRTEEDLINIAGGAAGVCFKADNNLEANEKRLMSCIKNGHTSVLEHATLTIRIRTDRATATALVRHRHCAFTQESTIYTKYTRFDTLSFVEMPDYDKFKKGYELLDGYNEALLNTCQKACDDYVKMLDHGLPAGMARDVLPNCTATILTITTNMRELQQILKIRKQPADSVRMHQVIAMLETVIKKQYPKLFNAFVLAEIKE